MERRDGEVRRGNRVHVRGRRKGKGVGGRGKGEVKRREEK